MITRYDVKSSRRSSHFLLKVHVYSTSFRNKSNACFYLISNSWKNGRWRPRWRPWLVTSQTSREGRGGWGMTLRVRPRVKNSRTPDHQLIAVWLFLHRARTRTEANCRCDVSFERSLTTYGSSNPVIRIARKKLNSDGKSLKSSASLAVVMKPETSEA